MATIRGQRSIDLAAAPAAVYDVLSDVAAYPDWQDDVKTAEVLETDGDGRPARAELTQDAKVRTVRVRVAYRHEPPHEMAWKLEKGDVKDLSGSWRLEDLGGGTRATYSLDVDPGRALGLLLRGPVVGRVTEHVLDGTLRALRDRVDGAG